MRFSCKAGNLYLWRLYKRRMQKTYSIYKIARYTLTGVCTLAILYFAWVMLGKVLPYFSFEHAIHFLGTKPDAVLDKRHFINAFYIHITSSMVVLVGGLFQFFPALVRHYPAAHRVLGKIYIATILLFAAPSGLILAFYANGGLPAKVGFTLQCIVWWALTFVAWREISKRRYQSHADMMIRSFAVTLAAMSLRTESYFMYYWFETKPIETYVTVTWLSWVGNLALAECLIYGGLGRWWIQTVFAKPLPHAT